jgi:hypothetical protein
MLNTSTNISFNFCLFFTFWLTTVRTGIQYITMSLVLHNGARSQSRRTPEPKHHNVHGQYDTRIKTRDTNTTSIFVRG